MDTRAVMVQHVSAPVPDEEVPEPLRGLIAKGLAKDPMQRPAGAAEFVAELEAVAVSGYGRDWQRRGLVVLGAAAAVFAATFPFAVLGRTAVAYDVTIPADIRPGRYVLSPFDQPGRVGLRARVNHRYVDTARYGRHRTARRIPNRYCRA